MNNNLFEFTKENLKLTNFIAIIFLLLNGMIMIVLLIIVHIGMKTIAYINSFY